jgi:hypothetical protein
LGGKITSGNARGMNEQSHRRRELTLEGHREVVSLHAAAWLRSQRDAGSR